MHKIALDPGLTARLTLERGGSLHVYDRIGLARTAHVVIDLQNGFMAEGAPVEVPAAREIVPDVNRISAAVREAGGLNVFIRFTTPPDSLTDWASFYARLAPEHRASHQAAFAPGAHYWQLWPGLVVTEGDLVMDKGRFSAFTPGTSELHAALQARGIDTLIITGTATNTCCESTARDAMQLNYKVVFVSDGNAARTDAGHNATLHNMLALFADVRSTEEVLALVTASA